MTVLVSGGMGMVIYILQYPSWFKQNGAAAFVKETHRRKTLMSPQCVCKGPCIRSLIPGELKSKHWVPFEKFHSPTPGRLHHLSSSPGHLHLLVVLLYMYFPPKFKSLWIISLAFIIRFNCLSKNFKLVKTVWRKNAKELKRSKDQKWAL